MRRGVSRSAIVALVLGLVIGGAVVFSAPLLIQGLTKTTTTTDFATVTSTAVSTSVSTQTSVLTSTVTQLSSTVSSTTVTETSTVTTTQNSINNQESSLVAVSGTLTVPGGSGEGTLVITVVNSANTPITLATVALDPADSGLTATSGGAEYSAGGPAFVMYSSSGGLPVGQSTSNVAPISGAVAGNTYTFTVTVDFSGGGLQAQTLSIAAQV